MYINNIVKRASTSIVNYPEVLSYLNKRLITNDDIKQYYLGYFSISTTNMLRDDGSEDYAVFKKDTMNYKHLEKKILIPLRNQMGNVYGLYARSLDKSFYKHYATSEEKLLGGFFGLFDALPSIYEKGYVYVVEGPMDCISLRKAFPNVVASLTAFINEQQIEFLKFFVKKIIVVFDGDAAGERGAESVSNTYGEKLISVKNLAGYKDANSCLTALGLEKFKKFAKNKLTVVM